MASKNSLLLMVKQRQGIRYHNLLAKILGEYSNINSARAALSRMVKDLEALGLLRRKDNRLFLTDKGILKIQTEMKNKLLLRLNELVKKPDPMNPGELVQQLSVLVERSKKDIDLLSAAKSSVSFPVSRLDMICLDIQKHSRHLSYLSRILSSHARAMRKMGFRDSITLSASEKNAKRTITKLAPDLKSEFIVETGKEKASQLAGEFNGTLKGESLLFPPENLEGILLRLFDGESLATVIAGSIRIDISLKKATFTGPAAKIMKLKK